MLRIGVPLHATDDVLQDVMLKVYININSFDAKKGTFSAWIYRIAHNESINHLKKIKTINFEDEDWQNYITSDNDFGLSFEKKELSQAVRAALSGLNGRYREPLALYYLEGKSYQEISYILKIPISTVGVRINRGKAKLKNLLKNWKGEL